MMQSLLYGFLFQLFQVELFFLFAVARNGSTKHEVVVLQLFLVRKDDGPFNDMLQFADVARPVVLFQKLTRLP